MGEQFVFVTDRIEFKSEGDDDFLIGYISTHDRDLVNDIVTKDCMMDMVAQFKTGNMKLDLEHESLRVMKDEPKANEALNIARIPLGRGVDCMYDGKGLIVKFLMNKEYKRFDSDGDVALDYKDVKKMVKNQMLDAFSMAFVPVRATMREAKDGVRERILDKIKWVNNALTGSPINVGARMLDVMLKSLDSIKDTDAVEKKDGTAQEGDKQDGGNTMSDEERKKLEAKAAEDAKVAEAAVAEKKAADEKAAAEAKAKDAEVKSLHDELTALKAANEKLGKEVDEMKAILDKPILKAFLTSGKQDAAKAETAAEKKSKEGSGPLDHI